jgi:hypothetical protein
MSLLNEIHESISEYSKLNNSLLDTYRTIESEVAEVKKRHLPAVIDSATKLKEIKLLLIGKIEEAKESFVKPKTQSLYGITFGFRKKKGSISVSDETVALIKKRYPSNYDEFLRVKEEPIKESLNNLSVKELKGIAVSVVADSDEVVIKSDIDKIEKFINSMIGEDAK